MSEKRSSNLSIYQLVTDRVIEAILRNQAVPWACPWRTGGYEGAPANLASKRAYSGINVLLLSMSGFRSKWWLTFRQVQKLGGTVKKGQRGTPIVFWSIVEKPDRDKEGTTKHIPLLRYSTVFNVEAQAEGINLPTENAETPIVVNPIESCEAIISSYINPPKFTEDGNAAYYSLASDTVNLPPRESFKSAEEYYSTKFHECIHSTAHPKRLDRKLASALSSFRSETYSREELVAEIGSCLLAAQAGIDAVTQSNSVAYLQGWVSVFKDQPRMLLEAAGAARKACAHILDGLDEVQTNEEVGM